MKKWNELKEYFFNLWDPHRQSFVFFKWNTWRVLLVIGLSVWLTCSWRSGFVKMLLDNVFVYLPNYLTHEMLGHNLVGNIFYRAFYNSYPAVGNWMGALAGNGVETLLPFLLVLGALRMQGGRWLLPPLGYWLATTFYGAGRYVQDARACTLPLTSSDMMTDYKAGEICGDWNEILKPIGLLEYDQWFAYTFFFLGSLCLVLAVYSAWYYWSHPVFDRQPAKPEVSIPAIDPNWQPPNIHNP